MGSVTIVSGNTVSETGVYSFQLTLPCALSSAAVFVYILPAVYDATIPCKTNSNCELVSTREFKISGYLSAGLNSGDVLTLGFSATNPPTVAPMIGTFQVVAYEAGYAAFSASTTLGSGQSYAAGTLTDLKVLIDEPLTYSSTAYVLVFTTNHRVPTGAYVVFTFPADLPSASATLKNVTISGVTILTAAQPSVGSLNLTKAFQADLYSPTEVRVAYSGIVNPKVVSTFSGFSASLQYAGYLIDSSDGKSASVTTAGSGTTKCELSDLTNSAGATYTFTFTAPDVFTTYTKYVTLKRPTSVQSCTLSTVSAISTDLVISDLTGADPTFKFKATVPSTASVLSFSIACVNPRNYPAHIGLCPDLKCGG